MQDLIAHRDMAEARQIIINIRPAFELVAKVASRKPERDWAEEMLKRADALIKAISPWGRVSVSQSTSLLLFWFSLRPVDRGLERIWHSDALRDAYKALGPAVKRIAGAADAYRADLRREAV